MTYVRVSITTNPTSLPPTRPRLWRVKHDAELGELWRFKVPEVFRLSPGHSIPLNREWQKFTFDLNQPGLTPDKWRVLYNHERAFSNKNAGYDYPGGTVKQDWINMRDTDATDVPKFDQPRICGGAVVTGRVDGGLLWLSYLDANLPPPRVEDVKLWHKFCATTVTESSIGRFPQRNGLDVWIPLIARQPVYLPLNNLQEWTAEELPDPYTIY